VYEVLSGNRAHVTTQSQWCDS